MLTKHDVVNCKFHSTMFNIVFEFFVYVHDSSTTFACNFIQIFIFTFTITTRTMTMDFYYNKKLEDRRKKSMCEGRICYACDPNETISSTEPIFENHLIRYICLYMRFFILFHSNSMDMDMKKTTTSKSKKYISNI